MKALEKWTVDHVEQSVFLCRHAEKHIVPGASSDLSVSITEEGQLESEKFGQLFSKKYGQIKHIQSSPILRCLETAQAFAHGCKAAGIENISSEKLGDPGVFVQDGELAGCSFDKFGACGVVQKYLAREKIPGMRPLEEAMELLLEDIVTDINQQSGPNLFVTHDAVLSAFVGALTGEKIDESNWFGYLEGVCIHKDHYGSLILCWNDKQYDVTQKAQEFLPSFASSFSMR